MVAEIALVLKGMAAGFTISMPVGPVAVLCITRTLHKGRISGLISGTGGTTADTFYALVAALGLTIVISFIENNRSVLQAIAGVIVIFFGVRIFTANPVKAYKNRMKEHSGLLSDYLSVLPLAFANPVSLFVYLGVFSGLSLTYSGSANAAALLMVPGVLAGSFMWWFLLSGIISRFRDRIKLRTLLWINQIAGGVIIVFGFILFIALFVT